MCDLHQILSLSKLGGNEEGGHCIFGAFGELLIILGLIFVRDIFFVSFTEENIYRYDALNLLDSKQVGETAGLAMSYLTIETTDGRPLTLCSQCLEFSMRNRF